MKICDADSHLMEPLDFLTSYADPAVRDRLPKIRMRGFDDHVDKTVRLVRDRAARDAEVPELEKNILGGVKGWRALGGVLAEERTRALDILGFEYQLVFSTFANTAFFYADDPVVMYGGARAHNRAMADFCRNDPRLVAVGGLPIVDPELAVREIREAARDRIRVFWIPVEPPNQQSPGHPQYDPVWRELESIGAIFVLHTASERRRLSLDYVDNGHPLNVQGSAQEGEAFSTKDIISRQYRPELFIASVACDGVFKRFPKLKAGVIEYGANWVPNFLERLDDGWRLFRAKDAALQLLDAPPSEYVRAHVKFTPFVTENVARMIQSAGPELFMFSSDYPHPEGGNAPIKSFERSLDSMNADAATRTRFYSSNMKEMLNLA
ncbi:MAG TPA: amidohydrolase family protein [Candidatus Binataceae bacterium]|nr:amidohydrolase family protein [Candidatus Binataceae bacterium]